MSNSQTKSFLLQTLLSRYQPQDSAQENIRQNFLAFSASHEDHLLRSCIPGHITASAFVVDPVGASVLLMHHKKLGAWFQPGGHADGESDVSLVARKELLEETGVSAVRMLSFDIFDLDIHKIPERKKEAAHVHYDVRFLMQAESRQIQKNHESNQLSWVPFDDLDRYTTEASIQRMAEKFHDDFKQSLRKQVMGDTYG